MRQSILLVDDDISIRENYTDILEDLGYSVATCGEDVEAIELFTQYKPDLVLLDISMNGDRRAGHKMCERMKEQTPTVPIIMLTSLESKENRQIAANNQAAGYLIKRADPAELIMLIDDVLSVGGR